MKDWEVNPDDYRKDDEGNFLLKLDGTPKKKIGRPVGSKSQYNFHSKTKASNEAKQTIRSKEKLIRKTKNKLLSHQTVLSNSKEVLSKLSDRKSSKGSIITADKLEKLPKVVKKEAEENIIFKANEGPQEDFLAASETDVLYGGAAGGGKSYAMLVDQLRYAHKAAHRALIIRRSMPELRELIDKSRELYPKAFPGCKYREV